jgi:hypothetical protein
MDKEGKRHLEISRSRRSAPKPRAAESRIWRRDWPAACHPTNCQARINPVMTDIKRHGDHYVNDDLIFSFVVNRSVFA